MSSINTAALINLLGFTVGAVLYAMLLVMVLRHPPLVRRDARSIGGHTFAELPENWLLFATAILGLVWNLGALATYGVQDFGVSRPLPVIVALSFTALGFLPAVVVHSALHRENSQAGGKSARVIMIAAYGLSVFAGAMHFYASLISRSGPSNAALRALTFGYLILIVALIFSTRGQPGWKRAVWGSALAVFAVSALHLSRHPAGGDERWVVELLGHHASLPLALAILYQDYRFAFADLFLKRALTLLLLAALTSGLYLFAVSPLLVISGPTNQTDPRAVGVLLALWMATALLYPQLRRAVVWFVETIVLGRADYGAMRVQLMRVMGTCESSEAVLEQVCRELAPALSAREVHWVKAEDLENQELGSVILDDLRSKSYDGQPAFVTGGLSKSLALRSDVAQVDHVVTLLDRSPTASAVVLVATAEPPYFALSIGPLSGGRRLLSDDIEMLESVAVMAARRIDALRITHERCEQGLREQEFSKLATEAQLRALRAQINPHFLFNALTTIGYLIRTSPDRALDTLMKLTDLLRRVLRSTDEFVTLGEELKLIESYLDIERERFEERLRVRVSVPAELLNIRLPSLLIQPLVENAIKHGIAPSRSGGEVSISARLEPTGTDGIAGPVLIISIADTGVGASELELARGRRRGVGLSNIEERLRCHSGQAARLQIASLPGAGTTVELRMPIQATGKVDRSMSRLTTGERKGA